MRGLTDVQVAAIAEDPLFSSIPADIAALLIRKTEWELGVGSDPSGFGRSGAKRVTETSADELEKNHAAAEARRQYEAEHEQGLFFENRRPPSFFDGH
jgi:hypothetical protein